MATTRERTEGQAALELEIDSDGVAWLVFDQPGSKVNILTRAVMAQLDQLLGEVEEGASTGRIKALVVRSGKPDSFIAGADIGEISGVRDPAEAEAGAREGQRVFRRLEQLPVPTIAAIDGLCLGGGTELTLACTHRLASDRPETKIGLPEVRLGIIPGFGGTIRLPRLIGVRAATEMIVTGKPVTAKKAERIGLIDERLPAPALLDRIRRFAWERIDRGPRRGARSRRLAERLLDETAPGRRLVLWQARKQVMRETKGHYPAPLAAIHTLGQTMDLPLEEAFAREAAVVGKLASGEVCKNLIHVFHLMEGAKKTPCEARPREVERVGVLGAGVMGGGIAHLIAQMEIPVRMKDIRPEAISHGLAHAREMFSRSVERRNLTRQEADQRLARISPTLDYSGFGTANVVIEAVVERMEVKRQALGEMESHLHEGAVLATNTSTLSVTEMQHGLKRPQDLCGMHFFNPVHRMPLIEVIRGAASSDEALATIFTFARRLGKTPIVVNDGPGFLVNRVLGPYMNEAGWLLSEGASVEAVDAALTAFGMPMGPLRLLDEVGFDVARHAGAVLFEAFGERLRPSPPLVRLGEGRRLGRKIGSGFYRYEGGKQQGVDEGIYTDLADSVPAHRREVAADEIVERCVLVMVNEAARVLADGIVERPGDVDLGMIAGTGFPPFRGGLLRYADSLGLGTVLARLEALAREHGPRFQPAPLIREHVDAGRGFYA